MPSLQDTLKKRIEGYAPVSGTPSRPTPPIEVGQQNKNNVNPTLRCPLPPFSAGPDSLRQFNENGQTPTFRVIPLPVSTGFGGSTTINTTTETSSGSSGGTTSTLTAKTVTYTSPLLSAGAVAFTVLTLAKSYQLIAVSVSSPAELRLYGAASSQAADAGRGLDSPVPAEVLNNMVTDIALDTVPYAWTWQNSLGVNTNNPQTTAAYLSIFNIGLSAARITVTLAYLPLES